MAYYPGLPAEVSPCTSLENQVQRFLTGSAPDFQRYRFSQRQRNGPRLFARKFSKCCVGFQMPGISRKRASRIGDRSNILPVSARLAWLQRLLIDSDGRHKKAHCSRERDAEFEIWECSDFARARSMHGRFFPCCCKYWSHYVSGTLKHRLLRSGLLFYFKWLHHLLCQFRLPLPEAPLSLLPFKAIYKDIPSAFLSHEYYSGILFPFKGAQCLISY